MPLPPSERAALERALLAIESVLARTVSGTPSGIQQGAPAHEALTAGLAAAAALVDVSQTLLRTSHDSSPAVLLEEWRTLVAHTQMAGQRVQRMVRLLAGEKHIAAAQGPLLPPRPLHPTRGPGS